MVVLKQEQKQHVRERLVVLAFMEVRLDSDCLPINEG